MLSAAVYSRLNESQILKPNAKTLNTQPLTLNPEPPKPELNFEPRSRKPEIQELDEALNPKP